MRRQLTILAGSALAMGQVAPAFAQATREAAPATRPAPAAEPQPTAQPQTRPSRPTTQTAPPPTTRPTPPPPTTRPTPGYERPVDPGFGRPPPGGGGSGWGGSGGSGGGGSGGGWRPPPGGNWTGPGRPPDYWPGWGNNGWGNDWNQWGGNYRRLTCESRDGRYRRCNADTQGRAGVLRTFSSTPCRQGYSWGYNRSHIWVSNGCRAEFAYGYGGSSGGSWNNSSVSASEVIAGVAIAAGLAALLTAASNSGSNRSSGNTAPPPPPPGGGSSAGSLPYPPHSGPARIVADFSALPSAAQAPARTCMDDVARQIGATGGSTVTWARTIGVEPGNGGYRFNVAIRADYPDGPRDMAIYCRATPDRVVQLDFAALSG